MLWTHCVSDPPLTACPPSLSNSPAPGDQRRQQYMKTFLSPCNFDLSFRINQFKHIQQQSLRTFSAHHLKLFSQHDRPLQTPNINHSVINMPSSNQVEILSAPEHPFDFESDPIQAMTTYSRDMFSHTKQQMSSACNSSRRRSGQRNSPVDAHGSLSKESTRSSTSSRTSL